MDFEEYVITFFKQKYGVDLTKEKNILIDDLIFPNFIVQKVLNFNQEEYTNFEYCRIINKIFGNDYLNSYLSYYEDENAPILKNDIVFDCGANTGIFTLYSSYKSKKVYAFEPATLIRHYLKYTATYNCHKISIVPAGVAQNNRQDILYQADNPGATRIQDIKMPEFHKILFKEKINLVSIDNFVQTTKIIPNFIKMDIEGAELNAVYGALETIKKHKPKLSISIHENNIDNIDNIKSLFPNDYCFKVKEQEFYDPVLICYPREEK